MTLQPQSHACCYFTGAVNVDGNIILKNNTIFEYTNIRGKSLGEMF